MTPYLLGNSKHFNLGQIIHGQLFNNNNNDNDHDHDEDEDDDDDDDDDNDNNNNYRGYHQLTLS